MTRALLLIPMLAACGENPFLTPEPPCDSRDVFYVDADGDGIGDVGDEVYITCEDPGDGWTRTPPPDDDTDVGDTDVGDTDVGDTDATDTDSGDTDG